MQLNLDPVPLGLVFGLAPIPRFDELGSNVEVDETVQDGRPVWEINSIQDVTGPNGVRAPRRDLRDRQGNGLGHRLHQNLDDTLELPQYRPRRCRTSC